jgi:hypothetical protein
MITTNNSSGCSNAAPDGRPQVTITVLPTNLALVQLPVEQQEPLMQYRDGFLGSEKLEFDQYGVRASEDLLAAPHSVVPAGLVPRLDVTLTVHGYKVTVTDERRFGKAFRVDKKLAKDFHCEPYYLFKAMKRQPLGQITYHGRGIQRYMQYLASLYPLARIMAVFGSGPHANDWYVELFFRLNHGRFGLRTRERARIEAPSLVTGVPWLRKQPPGRWDIILWVINSNSEVTETTCRALLSQRARRLYAFVPAPIPSGVPTDDPPLSMRKRLWLEALAGRQIFTVP